MEKEIADPNKGVEDSEFDFDKGMEEFFPSHKQKEDPNKGKKIEGDYEDPDDPDTDKGDDEDPDLKGISFDDDDDSKNKNKDKKNKSNDDEDPNKAVSLSNLRKQRDEAITRLQSFEEAAGDLDPDLIKSVREFIDENKDDDDLPTPDTIKSILQEAKESKDTIKELQEKLEEKDKRVQDLDIRSSEAFQNEYLRPLQEASSDLQVEIANVDPKGEVIAPEATKNFHASLMKEKDMDSMKMQKHLAKFASDFEKESGQKYEKPSTSAAMSAFRSFQKANKSANEAYSSWNEKKKESQTKLEQERAKQQEFQIKQDKQKRRAAAISGLRNFDLDLVDGVFDKNRLEKTFQAAFKRQEKMFEDPEQVPSYEDLMKSQVKADLFDDAMKELQELRKFKEEHEDEELDKAKDRGSSKKTNKKESDWLDMSDV